MLVVVESCVVYVGVGVVVWCDLDWCLCLYWLEYGVLYGLFDGVG